MIKLIDTTKRYNKGKPNELTVLNGVSLEVGRGEMLAVMGRSGAGKSTLLHIMSCIERCDGGSYAFDGVDVFDLSDRQLAKMRNRDIGIVLQDFALIMNETAIHNVSIPLYFDKTPIRKIRETAMRCMAEVGISHLAKRKTSTLSGGEKQRVAIARALIKRPKVLFADEPTGSLDSKTSGEIMDLLKSLNGDGLTVVIVTHDPKIAGECTRTVNISDGVLSDV